MLMFYFLGGFLNPYQYAGSTKMKSRIPVLIKIKMTWIHSPNHEIYKKPRNIAYSRWFLAILSQNFRHLAPDPKEEINADPKPCKSHTNFVINTKKYFFFLKHLYTLILTSTAWLWYLVDKKFPSIELTKRCAINNLPFFFIFKAVLSSRDPKTNCILFQPVWESGSVFLTLSGST